jgi:hypothetical protein
MDRKHVHVTYYYFPMQVRVGHLFYFYIRTSLVDLYSLQISHSWIIPGSYNHNIYNVQVTYTLLHTDLQNRNVEIPDIWCSVKCKT